MSTKTPQEQLEEFRASKPDWLMRILEGAPTESDRDALIQSEYIDPRLYREAVNEYESILRQIPHAVRDRDRRRVQEYTKVLVAPSRLGRPRKDALAREICDLHLANWGWKRIAQSINEKYGSETTTEDAVRKLFAASQTRPRSTRKTPEEQLAEFEASHPEWLIRIFELGFSYSESDSYPDFDSNSGSDFDCWRNSKFVELKY